MTLADELMRTVMPFYDHKAQGRPKRLYPDDRTNSAGQIERWCSYLHWSPLEAFGKSGINDTNRHTCLACRRQHDPRIGR